MRSIRKSNKVDENTLENIKTLQQLKNNIREVKKCYSEMSKDKMANYVKEICQTSDLIVKEVSLNQHKISKVNLLTDHYLPVLVKMLHQYINIKKNKLTGKNCDEIRQTVEDMLPQIHQAFKELLNKLFNDENEYMDVEIKVMMNEFKRRGLLDD